MTGVLFVDLDHFKRINDPPGHHAGDLVLQETARRVCSCLRTSDVVARLGGDEFVVLVQQVDRSEDIEDIGRNILNTVAAPIDVNGQALSITASVGIFLYGADARNETQLRRHADIAMYAAKRGGKDSCRFYESVERLSGV